MTTYLITAKNLFSATILINVIKKSVENNPERLFIIHSPTFLEVYLGFSHYIMYNPELKNHMSKLVSKEKLKNSTKYTTMEL